MLVVDLEHRQVNDLFLVLRDVLLITLTLDQHDVSWIAKVFNFDFNRDEKLVLNLSDVDEGDKEWILANGNRFDLREKDSIVRLVKRDILSNHGSWNLVYVFYRKHGPGIWVDLWQLKDCVRLFVMTLNFDYSFNVSPSYRWPFYYDVNVKVDCQSV